MEYKTDKEKTYSTGGIGTSSTGPKGGEPSGPHGSLSNDCGVQKCERQASTQQLDTDVITENPRDAIEVERWFNVRMEEEIFRDKPKVKRTPPGRDKSFTSTQNDASVNVNMLSGDSIIFVSEDDALSNRDLENKIDSCVETIKVLAVMLSETNSTIWSIIKKDPNTNPDVKQAVMKMDSCFGKMMTVVDQLNGVRKETKAGNAGKMTVDEDATNMDTRMIAQEAERENNILDKTEGRATKNMTCKETQTSPHVESFPSITGGNKRKEISPPQGKAGKKSKADISKPTFSVPRIRSIESRFLNSPVSENDPETVTQWEIVRKKTNKNRTGTPIVNKETVNTLDTRGKNSIKRKRIKPQAIAVRFDTSLSFAEVLKRVKKTVGASPEGLKGLRQTRAGNLLLEFVANADIETFKNKIEGKLGSGITITKLQGRIDLEIKNIDPDAEKEDILAALQRDFHCPLNEVRLKTLRTDPRKNKTMIINGPEVLFRPIAEVGKIKIGWTVATIKEVPQLIRCYKCHSIGHMAVNCSRFPNKDIILCRKCGTTGHGIQNCDRPPRCLLCAERGVDEKLLSHVAASIKCPVYKDAIRNTALNS